MEIANKHRETAVITTDTDHLSITKPDDVEITA